MPEENIQFEKTKEKLFEEELDLDFEGIEKKEQELEKAIEKNKEDLGKYRLPQIETEEGKNHGTLISDTNNQRAKKEREEQIEKVLAEDLDDIFISLPKEKQLEFKLAGEKTAIEINTLLDRTKVKVKKIISLIKKWLLIIPGINVFFLEQEAKIKTDEIMKLKKM